MKFTLICLSIFIIGICCQDTLFATYHDDSFDIKWNNNCKRYRSSYNNLDVIVYKNSVITGADKMNLTIYLEISEAKNNDYEKCHNFFDKSFYSNYFEILSDKTLYVIDDGILCRKYLACEFLVSLQNISNLKYINKEELRFSDNCHDNKFSIVSPEEFDKIDEKKFMPLLIIIILILTAGIVN